MIAGIVGFLWLVAAAVLGYQEFGFRTGNLILGGVLMGLVVGGFGWLRFFPESRMAPNGSFPNAPSGSLAWPSRSCSTARALPSRPCEAVISEPATVKLPKGAVEVSGVWCE